MERPPVLVIGGGLAGSEAAWQAAERGCAVQLVEMRPLRSTPAHRTAHLAELVCSNSFKSENETSAHGLLKRELRELGAHLLTIADTARVPAGSALAVDREVFARGVEQSLEAHPHITIVRDEAVDLPAATPTVVASGPLTSDRLSQSLSAVIGGESLFFFDAIAPIVDADSIDHQRAFPASRYEHGEDYLNCPFDEASYHAFRNEFCAAESASVKDFDRQLLFEGCLPIEELAARGELTMAFGPLKPVGLRDPATGRRPFAVVQLRAENVDRTMYGLVGFQTRLKYGEQTRIFKMIPGLEDAEFLRLGSMHRNAFIDSPRVLTAALSLRQAPHVLVAGQLTGAEGYVEAQSTGFLAGVNLARLAHGRPPLELPPTTAIGALCHFLATAPVRPFQPMNFNFGLLPPIELRGRGRDGRRRRKVAQVERARDTLHGTVAAESDLELVTAVEPAS